MSCWSYKAREVTKMLSNCNYDKIKLLYKVSKTIGFIEKHAIKDAEKDNHPKCAEIYRELQKDLEKHLDKLRIATEVVSREGQLKS